MPLTMEQREKRLDDPPLCEQLPVRDYLDNIMVRTSGAMPHLTPILLMLLPSFSLLWALLCAAAVCLPKMTPRQIPTASLKVTFSNGLTRISVAKSGIQNGEAVRLR